MHTEESAHVRAQLPAAFLRLLLFLLQVLQLFAGFDLFISSSLPGLVHFQFNIYPLTFNFLFSSSTYSKTNVSYSTHFALGILQFHAWNIRLTNLVAYMNKLVSCPYPLFPNVETESAISERDVEYVLSNIPINFTTFKYVAINCSNLGFQ